MTGHRSKGRRVDIKRKPEASLVSSRLLPRVCGETNPIGGEYTESYIHRFAKRNRRRLTSSEQRFEILLRNWNDGILRGRYKPQHPISGKWIVDFYFSEVRLAIEIDGSIHGSPEQMAKDLEKTSDCKRFDITLLRLSNEDVWGDEDRLLSKVRQSWREAKSRKNVIIGMQYP